jgi:hypothetical protein
MFGFLVVAGISALAAPPEKLTVFQTGERFAGLDEEIYQRW